MFSLPISILERTVNQNSASSMYIHTYLIL